ncbi:MAG: hypothetical protein IIZ63_11045 [Caulobacteraceae bacterium]|nr:hypothetical protein [Caulobacteraceae bacterium]
MTQTPQDRPAAAPILVLGGAGKTGRRVAARLAEAGEPVRIGSRAGAPPFDWNAPSGWAAVLDGARAAYIAYAPDLAAPGGPEAVAAFAELAVRQGVRRLVLLSGRGEEEALRAERLLRETGAAWTVLRSSWFAQNFSESFLRDAVMAGEVLLPVDGAPEPFIDADDIAEIAAAALTRDGHEGRTYDITGPELLTFAEATAVIAEAAGRPVRLRSVSPAAFSEGMVAQGAPAELAEVLVELFGKVLDGRNASLTDGVQRALGRPPTRFADYARRAAAAGAWA